MRLKLTLEYAGTRYSGWQIQKNARTVQGELQRAIHEATGSSSFELYGSGRTDAGVHALAQVAHVELDTSAGRSGPSGQPHSLELLRRHINDALPSDVNVLKIEKVPHRFHARHSAIARSYIYQIARRRTAFAKNYVWWVKDPLDIDAIRALAAQFVGMHDFRSFSDEDPDDRSTQVLVDALDVHEDGDLILVHIEGSHFIWKMVRRLVGVLVEVGRGGLAAEEAANMLRQPSPLPAKLTAPAAGLFLERVYYEGDPRDLPVQSAVLLTSWR